MQIFLSEVEGLFMSVYRKDFSPCWNHRNRYSSQIKMKFWYLLFLRNILVEISVGSTPSFGTN